jgi:hypothetical protein
MARDIVLKSRNSVIGSKVIEIVLAAYDAAHQLLTVTAAASSIVADGRWIAQPESSSSPIAQEKQQMRLSISPDVLRAHVSGEAVLLNLADKNYYGLNETSAAVWAGLERGETPDKILSTLLEQYDISESEAAKRIDDVIGDFRERKLIVDSL